MGDNTPLYFQIIATDKKVCFDYTPKWNRSAQQSGYVDNVIFPKVLTNKKYSYRVVSNGGASGPVDLNREAYPVEADGSQKVNFTEYNAGYGFAASKKIQIYAVDPSNGNQYLVAQLN